MTDPKTISVVAPAQVLKQIKVFAKTQGLLCQDMHIRGKVHNPENKTLAADLDRFCATHEGFRFPDTLQLQVSLRSNVDGKCLGSQSLTHEVINTILSTRCEWYQLLQNVAADLSESDREKHYLINFGIGDCLSPVPFHQHGLHIIKSEARATIKQAAMNPALDQPFVYEYPSNAMAIIGAACRYPGANDMEELWDLLSSGRSTVDELRQNRVNTKESSRLSQDQGHAGHGKFYANLIDRCDTFDHNFFGIKPREAMYMDPQQRLLLETSYQAVESSGYLRTHKRGDGHCVGVFIGASFVEYLTNLSSHPPTAYNSVGTLKAFLCGRISHYFGWTGPAETIDTACSSSLVAINRACKAIQSGECSMALAGGVNIISSLENFLDLGKAGFLSPTGQCKPFDKDADGYCRSEGVGLLFLEPLDQALRHEHPIQGVICGVATNQGGLSSSITVPHSQSQVALFRDILEQANTSPDKVTYVEAHGTGTQVGDPVEVASIREVFGSVQRITPLHIGSIKGNIGHCETAAGVAGCIKALMLLQKGTIPPLASHKTLNSKIPNLEQDCMTIAPYLQPWTVPFRAICVNSYGAAGSNAALLMCQPPPRRSGLLSEYRNLSKVLPFVLSAASEPSLIAYMRDLKDYLEKSGSSCSAADVAFTLSEKREPHRFRWATFAHDLDDVSVSLGVADHQISQAPCKARSVVLVFCGQVSRAVGVKSRLYESCALFRSLLDQCDQIVQDLGLQSLFPSIFDTEPISDIKTVHCCLFAYQYATALSWIKSGLPVEAVIGQSFGELTALAVVGILSLKDALTLVSKRASLIESHWGPDNGLMLSVRCSLNDAHQVVADMKEHGEEIEIACHNAEDSYVIGGTENAISTTEHFQGRRYPSLKASRLNVTHAYHTKLTETILDDLDSVAASLKFQEPNIAFETCTQDGQGAIMPKHIRAHMRNPVYFQRAVCRLEKRLGGCIWLEAGSDSPSFALVKRAVASPQEHIFHPLRIDGSEDPMQAICEVTTKLWNEGIPVSYWNFHNPQEQRLRHVWLPPYHFEEAQHWLPYLDYTTKILGAKSNLDSKESQSRESVRNETPQLLKRLSPRLENAEEELFEINLSHTYFRDIVTGHAVLDRPLCPAGLYLECSIRAMRLTPHYQRAPSIHLGNCEFESPLGVSPDHPVTISIRRAEAKMRWAFEISSSGKEESPAKTVIHAKGYNNQASSLRIGSSQRNAVRQIQRLRSSGELEILRKDKVYKMFSRVVNYSVIFRKISVIKWAGTEAVAEVEVPCSESDNTSADLCSAVSLDAFLQVCGILINCHDTCPTDRAYLAVGIESICISQCPNLAHSGQYTVYAVFEPLGSSQALGDVFVLHPNNDVVATMTGIRFASVPLTTLAKMLDASHHGPKHEAEDVQGQAATTTHPPAVAVTANTNNATQQQLVDLLSQHSGCPANVITGSTTMENLGIDSLAKIELKAEIESTFDQEIDDSVLGVGNTVESLLARIHFHEKVGSTTAETERPERAMKDGLGGDPLAIITEVNASFLSSAEKKSFAGFWGRVAPRIDDLVLVYISTAFRSLGADLFLLADGESVPKFELLPKYAQLVNRLWSILERLDIVARDAGHYVRTSKPILTQSSVALQSDIALRYPQHTIDLSLLALTGPVLADCLTGAVDPLKLLFGSARSQQILGDFYHKSPMFATMTDQLLLFIKRIVAEASLEVVRIIEVGAGFGGTTSLLAEMLQNSRCKVQYTFTDVAPTLVDKTRKTFSTYQWMTFQTLDIEQDPPTSLQQKYDIVIATNVVHATSDLVASLWRLKSLLRNGGFVCLSEITKAIKWFDLVFGLLPGWWCFNDGRSYALQSAEQWMKVFKKAGFESTAFSTGPSEEAKSQQLLIGSTRVVSEKAFALHSGIPANVKSRIETVIYKSVDNVDIHADIYFPTMSSSVHSMPIGK